MSTDARARQEVASGETMLGSRCVPYRVIRSRRARQVRLRLLSGGTVEIVVPPRIRVPAVAEILRAKQGWIERQLDRLHALPPSRPDAVEFLGTEYAVIVQRRPGRTGRILMEECTLRLDVPDEIEVAPIIEKFLRQRARVILFERAQAWADVMQVEYRRLSVRDQRTRWGSCSVNGGLNFSWRLVMAPLPVLDYVVVHELMHLREMNHGRRFWEGVATYCPEYQEHRAWLKENGASLARQFMAEA